MVSREFSRWPVLPPFTRGRFIEILCPLGAVYFVRIRLPRAGTYRVAIADWFGATRVVYLISLPDNVTLPSCSSA